MLETKLTPERSEYKDAMKSYMKDIDSIPLLAKERELELGHIVSGYKNIENPSPEQTEKYNLAVDEIIEANLRLVVKIAHDFKGYGLGLQDLISEGNIGLMRAANKYDPERGAKFSSYAAWWIKQGMRRALSNQAREVRIPVQTEGKIARIDRARRAYILEFGREPNYEELSKMTGLSNRTTKNTYIHANKGELSLNSPIKEGEDGEMMDVIPDESSPNPHKEITKTDDYSQLLKAIEQLNEWEKTIIIHRFGLFGNKPQTLEELTLIIGRTRERIRQIETRGIEKLRKLLPEYTGLTTSQKEKNYSNGNTQKRTPPLYQKTNKNNLRTPIKETPLETEQRIKFLEEYSTRVQIERENRKKEREKKFFEKQKGKRTERLERKLSGETSEELSTDKRVKIVSEKVREIIKLYQENHSGTEIAKIIDCSEARIYQILREERIQMRGTKIKYPSREEGLKLYEECERNAGDFATKLQVSKQTARNYLKSIGVEPYDGRKKKKKEQEKKRDFEYSQNKKASKLEEIATQNETEPRIEKHADKRINEETRKKIIEGYLEYNRNSTLVTEKLGISKHTVLKYWKEQGFKIRKRGETDKLKQRINLQDKEKVLEIYQECGGITSNFADRLQVSEQTARSYLKSVGVELKKGKRKALPDHFPYTISSIEERALMDRVNTILESLSEEDKRTMKLYLDKALY